MLQALDLPLSLQAVLATLMTWLLTSLGALVVFFFRREHRALMNAMLAAGAGVMLASSFWSLLDPGITLAAQQQQSVFLTCGIGFLFGGLFLLVGETIFEHLSTHVNQQQTLDAARRRRLLIASITLHNIPEGMAVGVAFGAATNQQSLWAAWILAIGIGLQNIPEGAAVSLPLQRDGYSRSKAAGIGILSGIVEPLAALFGALLASTVQSLLPFSLCFAAGAMIFVIVSELIPESQRSTHPTIMTIATLLGFAVMMLLDVLLS